MGHSSCETLLWDTVAGHSCGTLLWDTHTGHFCGTLYLGQSCRTHASRLQDERFVRDFLHKSRVKSPKRAFRTRLPPKVTCQSAHGGSQSAVPAKKSAHGGSQIAVPATNSAPEGSQSVVPATKSDHIISCELGGSQSAAPATKSAHGGSQSAVKLALEQLRRIIHAPLLTSIGPNCGT